MGFLTEIAGIAHKGEEIVDVIESRNEKQETKLEQAVDELNKPLPAPKPLPEDITTKEK